MYIYCFEKSVILLCDNVAVLHFFDTMLASLFRLNSSDSMPCCVMNNHSVNGCGSFRCFHGHLRNTVVVILVSCLVFIPELNSLRHFGLYHLPWLERISLFDHRRTNNLSLCDSQNQWHCLCKFFKDISKLLGNFLFLISFFSLVFIDKATMPITVLNCLWRHKLGQLV